MLLPVTMKLILEHHFEGGLSSEMHLERVVRREKALQGSYEQGYTGLSLVELSLLAILKY